MTTKSHGAQQTHACNHVVRGLATGLLAASLSLLAVADTLAVPFSSDVSISGSVRFDDVNSFVSGDATQSGTLQLVQGGVTSTSSYSGSSAVGSNPLTSNLTDLNDGIGFNGTAQASGLNQSSTFLTGIDLGLSLTNNSATNTYQVLLNIAFDHTVSSSGSDAYADSEFVVRDALGSQLFISHLTSDTVNGNERNGVALGSSGGLVSDAGPATLTITLNPLDIVSLTDLLIPNNPFWTLNGGAFSGDATAEAALNAFISVAAVRDVSNPNPTPEPATLALLGLGLAGLGALRRAAR